MNHFIIVTTPEKYEEWLLNKSFVQIDLIYHLEYYNMYQDSLYTKEKVIDIIRNDAEFYTELEKEYFLMIENFVNMH